MCVCVCVCVTCVRVCACACVCVFYCNNDLKYMSIFYLYNVYLTLFTFPIGIIY